MSTTFSVVFQTKVPPYGTLGGDHLVLNDVRKQLDQFAATRGLTSLLTFESYEPEDFDGLVDEDTLAQQPPAKWFTPATGVVAVGALIAHLDAHPDALPQHAAVRKDLAEVMKELRTAEQAGVQFRFAVIT